jgi:ABC-type transporter Mla subunit MlaD
MDKANKIKLGAFVIIAVTMIVGSFLAIGTLKFFEPRFKAMTVLNTSVEGMSLGSPVKYMGVPIGRVTRIGLRDVDGFINVYFDIFPSSIDIVGKDKPIAFSGGLSSNNIIEQKGLLCFLNASGIMGGTYLELTVSDSMRVALPGLAVNPPPGVFYIRSRNSHVSNVIQNIGLMLEQLTQVNFVQLADRIKSSLDNADKILNNSELNEMISRWNRISKDVEYSSANFRDIFNKERVQRIIEIIEYAGSTAESLKKTLPPEKIAQMSDDLVQSAKELKIFLGNAEESRGKLTQDINDVKNRMMSTLLRVERTLNILTEMITSLENDPSQMFLGKKKRVIFTTAPPAIP